MKKIKLKQWDKIEINWIDSIENTSGWTRPVDFKWKDHYNALFHNLIGYYINECTDAITVCQAYALENENSFVGAFTVPKGCILKIRKLK